MPYAGNVSLTKLDNNNILYLECDSLFDADAEFLLIDLESIALKYHMNRYPNKAIFKTISTHATVVVDIVSLKLQGSVDGTTYDDLSVVTDADPGNAGGAGPYTTMNQAATWDIPYRYLKLIDVTNGTGNLHNLEAWLYHSDLEVA